MKSTFEKFTFSSIISSIKRAKLFTILTLISWVLTCFHVTAASGSWVTYSMSLLAIPITSNLNQSQQRIGKLNQNTPGKLGSIHAINSSIAFNTTTEVKIGLFNAATNNSWYLAPYSSCIAQIDKKQSARLLSDHYMFCNAQLANGIMILISLILSFIGSVLLTAVLLRGLSLVKVLIGKKICLFIYSAAALINTIAFLLGATILYQLTSRDFPGSYYGIGFIASILNSLLSIIILLGVYFLIDAFGTTRSFSILGEIPGIIQGIHTGNLYSTKGVDSSSNSSISESSNRSLTPTNRSVASSNRSVALPIDPFAPAASMTASQNQNQYQNPPPQRTRRPSTQNRSSSKPTYF